MAKGLKSVLTEIALDDEELSDSADSIIGAADIAGASNPPPRPISIAISPVTDLFNVWVAIACGKSLAKVLGSTRMMFALV